MKNLTLYIALLLFGCEQPWDFNERYFIAKGTHSSGIKAEFLQSSVLGFYATFDSSAIYTSRTEVNQWDTNKLMGFADCNSYHHDNSARFGWRWLEGQLDIMVYAYVDGDRVIEKIGEARIGEPSYYEIQLTNSEYIFYFNNKTINVTRNNDCNKGGYYMLYPYFGGDEVAPHDITIYIKREYM